MRLDTQSWQSKLCTEGTSFVGEHYFQVCGFSLRSISLCEALLLCLFETPDGIVKRWTANSEAEARAGRAGRQRE